MTDIAHCPTVCVWNEDAPDWSMWETTCGNAFTFNDGGPTDNDFKFCPYCGNPIESSPYVDPADEDDES